MHKRKQTVPPIRNHHEMDYLLKIGPSVAARNPRKFEIVYTNRYGSVVSVPVHGEYNVATIEAANLERQGIEAIIKDVSAMAEQEFALNV